MQPLRLHFNCSRNIYHVERGPWRVKIVCRNFYQTKIRSGKEEDVALKWHV
jgi:hypothetical protein